MPTVRLQAKYEERCLYFELQLEKQSMTRTGLWKICPQAMAFFGLMSRKYRPFLGDASCSTSAVGLNCFLLNSPPTGLGAAASRRSATATAATLSIGRPLRFVFAYLKPNAVTGAYACKPRTSTGLETRAVCSRPRTSHGLYVSASYPFYPSQ